MERAGRVAGEVFEEIITAFCTSRLFHIYGINGKMAGMKKQAVRTTVDIPAALYRKLKAHAAGQGRSVRELILMGVRATLAEGRRPRSRRVKFPLIKSAGPKVALTNEQIYEHVEFS
ncbi:MAG: hypothetical protein ACHP8A_19005 [Terriglobales bacterium]